MKKFRNLLMVILMALVSVGFASCGDDDEPEGTDIVGTWQYNHPDEGDIEVFFQFTKDGKFHQVQWFLDVEYGMPDHMTFHGKYAVSGKKLTITFDPNPLLGDDIVPLECDYSVQGDRLMLLTGDQPITFNRVQDSVIQPYL